MFKKIFEKFGPSKEQESKEPKVLPISRLIMTLDQKFNELLQSKQLITDFNPSEANRNFRLNIREGDYAIYNDEEVIIAEKIEDTDSADIKRVTFIVKKVDQDI